MEKILLADCYGVVRYEDLVGADIRVLREITNQNLSCIPVLCVVQIEEDMHAQVEALLDHHQFDEALKLIKQVPLSKIRFLDAQLQDNWAKIPNPVLDKSK